MSDDSPPGSAQHQDRVTYRDALRLMLVQMAPPYGFTLAAFTAGSLTAYVHGTPGPLEVLLFLAGACIGYGALIACASCLSTTVVAKPVPMRGWQMVHVFPLAVVFLISFASAELVRSEVAWFTSGVGLTVGYVGTLTTLLMYVHRSSVSTDG